MNYKKKLQEFFGYDNGVDLPCTVPQVEVNTRMGARPRAEIVPTALAEALSDLIYHQVRPMVRFAPATKFQLHQVRLLMTPENMTFVGELAAHPRGIRNDVGVGAMKEATGAESIDFSKFCDFRIETGRLAEQDRIVTVIAGNGPDRIDLSFEFYGIPVSQTESESIPHVNSSAAGQADPNTILTLRFTEDEQPERTVHFAKLPVVIGRNSNADVVLDSSYISRPHLTILTNDSGQLQVLDQSQLGSAMGDTLNCLPRGRAVPLPGQGKLILAPGAGRGAVHIIYQHTVSARDRQMTLVNIAATPAPPLPLEKIFTPHHGAVPPPASPIVSETSAKPQASMTLDSSATAAATLVSDPHTKVWRNGTALARLRIRKHDGYEVVVEITELPFEIGRESGAEHHYLVDDECSNVSRKHLRIERLQGGGFLTENLSITKNGTWYKTERLGARFCWQPIAQPSSTEGWYILGKQALDDKAIALRLESAR